MPREDNLWLVLILHIDTNTKRLQLLPKHSEFTWPGIQKRKLTWFVSMNEGSRAKLFPVSCHCNLATPCNTRLPLNETSQPTLCLSKATAGPGRLVSTQIEAGILGEGSHVVSKCIVDETAVVSRIVTPCPRLGF